MVMGISPVSAVAFSLEVLNASPASVPVRFVWSEKFQDVLGDSKKTGHAKNKG